MVSSVRAPPARNRTLATPCMEFGHRLDLLGSLWAQHNDDPVVFHSAGLRSINPQLTNALVTLFFCSIFWIRLLMFMNALLFLLLDLSVWICSSICNVIRLSLKHIMMVISGRTFRFRMYPTGQSPCLAPICGNESLARRRSARRLPQTGRACQTTHLRRNRHGPIRLPTAGKSNVPAPHYHKGQ